VEKSGRTFNQLHDIPRVLRIAAAISTRNPSPTKLAELLGVGDGAIRTIISRLREADLIEISKAGCELTQKGRDIWGQFEEVFPKEIDFGKSELNPNEYNYAFLVRNCGEKVGSGI
jgi:transcription initiation factor IIE alpha subunit